MPSPLSAAAQQLIDPQARALAANVRWLQLKLGGALANLNWPVAVLGEGAPLLMLHGFDSSFLEFRRIAPLLASNYQLWIPDLCGFGFCPRPIAAAYGPQLVIEHLLALTAVINAENPSAPLGLIGASMGGAVAIVLARELEQANPKKTAANIVTGTSWINRKTNAITPITRQNWCCFPRLSSSAQRAMPPSIC